MFKFDGSKVRKDMLDFVVYSRLYIDSMQKEQYDLAVKLNELVINVFKKLSSDNNTINSLSYLSSIHPDHFNVNKPLKDDFINFYYSLIKSYLANLIELPYGNPDSAFIKLMGFTDVSILFNPDALELLDFDSLRNAFSGDNEKLGLINYLFRKDDKIDSNSNYYFNLLGVKNNVVDIKKITESIDRVIPYHEYCFILAGKNRCLEDEGDEVKIRRLNELLDGLFFDRVNDLFESSCTKINDNNYKGALDDLNEALSLDPGFGVNSKLLIQRAYLKRLVGDYEKSISDINQAFDVDSDYQLLSIDEIIQAYLIRGNSNFDLHRFNDALIDFTSSINIKVSDEALLGAGNIKLLRGDLNGAKDDYLSIIERNNGVIKDDFSKMLANLGIIFLIQGDYTNADYFLGKSVEINSADGEALCNLGVVKLYQNNYPDAIRFFSSSINLKPLNSKAYHNRGIAFLFNGDLSNSIDDFLKSFELSYDSESSFNFNLIKPVNDYVKLIKDSSS